MVRFDRLLARCDASATLLLASVSFADQPAELEFGNFGVRVLCGVAVVQSGLRMEPSPERRPLFNLTQVAVEFPERSAIASWT